MDPKSLLQGLKSPNLKTRVRSATLIPSFSGEQVESWQQRDAICEALVEALDTDDLELTTAATAALAHLASGKDVPSKPQPSPDKTAAKRRRRRAKRRRPRSLEWLFWLVVFSPIIGAVTVTPFFVFEPPFVVPILLDSAILVVAFGVVLMWFRCPSCKKLFAAQLTKKETQQGTEWTAIRDERGESHTVLEQTTKTIRHYCCKHCGHTFIR